MGGRHAEAIARSASFRVTAVADTNPVEGKALGERVGAVWLGGIEELLDRDDVEIVAVCTPTTTHACSVRRSLEAGRHVFCEKPLAPSSREVADLLGLADQTGRRLRVGYLYRHAPAFIRMHELLALGAIGEPHLAIFRIGGRGSHRSWKHTRDAAGGAIFDMMSHMVDLAIWLLGPARDVRQLSRDILVPERQINGETVRADAEDFVVAEWVARSGARCLVEADLASPSFMQYAEVHGSNGSVFGSIIDDLPSVIHLTSPKAGLEAGTSKHSEPSSRPIDAQWAAFAAQLADPSLSDDPADTLATAKVLELLAPLD